MMTPALERCRHTNVYTLKGEDLRLWRVTQPGTFKARNGESRIGWTQSRAAEWMGMSTRTWQAWEGNEYLIPERAVRRVVEYSVSLSSTLDKILEG